MKTKLMLKNLRQDNNKGFSLVELIVVVIIIAVIAAALAPQVVKYVGKARENTDDYKLAEIKSCALTAVAECSGKFNVDAEDYKWYDADGLVLPYDRSADKSGTDVNINLGQLIQDNIGKDLGKNALGHDYLISVGKDASVTVTQLDN